MVKGIHIKLWVIITVLMTVLSTSCIKHGNKVEYIFTYAENHPGDYPTTLGALEFARLAEEKSEGRIIIDVKCDGELGDELSVIKQLKFGGIDFARVSVSPLSGMMPVLNVLQMPYLYRNGEHMWNVLDSEIGGDIFSQFEGSGIHPLSFYNAGARNFYNNIRPINKMEDLKGLKIRVQQSELMKDMVNYLGAEPVAQEYSNVYASLQRGVIDGAENNIPSYISAMHYQYAKYYTKDEHTRVPEIQMCSEVTWSKLSEEDREIIKEAAIESSRYERRLWDEKETVYEEMLIKEGVEINTLSPDERNRFKVTLEPLYEEYCKDYMDFLEKINEK